MRQRFNEEAFRWLFLLNSAMKVQFIQCGNHREIVMKYQESETVELKKSTSELKEAVISIVAMLNKHQQGEVLPGV